MTTTMTTTMVVEAVMVGGRRDSSRAPVYQTMVGWQEAEEFAGLIGGFAKAEAREKEL